MSLPLVNVTPKYELTIPSTGKQVVFRPYLVKEEKVLLMAFESQDPKTILRTMLETIGECVQEEINLDLLTTFDVEYMFLKIRSKSVGETSNILIKCRTCEVSNEVTINLDEVEVEGPEQSNIIKLTDTVSIEMKYPTYTEMMQSDFVDINHVASTGDMMTIILRGIGAILTEEERFDARDYTLDEISAFVDSLTAGQFGEITRYFQNMPQLQHEVEYECMSCRSMNSITLKGMADFF